jgi:hypothetical protein
MDVIFYRLNMPHVVEMRDEGVCVLGRGGDKRAKELVGKEAVSSLHIIDREGKFTFLHKVLPPRVRAFYFCFYHHTCAGNSLHML